MLHFACVHWDYLFSPQILVFCITHDWCSIGYVRRDRSRWQGSGRGMTLSGPTQKRKFMYWTLHQFCISLRAVEHNFRMSHEIQCCRRSTSPNRFPSIISRPGIRLPRCIAHSSCHLWIEQEIMGLLFSVYFFTFDALQPCSMGWAILQKIHSTSENLPSLNLIWAGGPPFRFRYCLQSGLGRMTATSVREMQQCSLKLWTLKQHRKVSFQSNKLISRSASTSFLAGNTKLKMGMRASLACSPPGPWSFTDHASRASRVCTPALARTSSFLKNSNPCGSELIEMILYGRYMLDFLIHDARSALWCIMYQSKTIK